MSTAELWPWASLLLFGALHGVNPGMGWLFAVALGLQERRARAVWRALPPLALGHALAIALAVTVAALVGRALPAHVLRWIVAVALLSFGITRLLRHRHIRFGGMRVGPRDLTIWSFLMATGHGAGLMILPFVLRAGLGGASGNDIPHAGHLHEAPLAAGASHEMALGFIITALHTAGYLLVAGSLAWLVYRKLGLNLLRTHWINVDLLWAAALIATALATPFLG